jgi:hypothetical protein
MNPPFQKPYVSAESPGLIGLLVQQELFSKFVLMHSTIATAQYTL